jgi:hypothetical protein
MFSFPVTPILFVIFAIGAAIYNYLEIAEKRQVYRDRSDTQAYPNLPLVRSSIKALYKHLSYFHVHVFAETLSPQEIKKISDDDVVLRDGRLSKPKTEDSLLFANRMVSLMAERLKLPKGLVIVNYRKNMEAAGQVELSPEDEYFVDINARYRETDNDIAAILAHEIMHVFLYRYQLVFADNYENEILTDTASVYLGIGWPLLNAYRISTTHEQRGDQVFSTTHEEKLGYLTPEEYGYVFGKRLINFKDNAVGKASLKEDRYITSAAAKVSFQRGFQKAQADYQQPPLKSCGFLKRSVYQRHKTNVVRAVKRDKADRVNLAFHGYRFEVSDGVKVIFNCPICTQRLRIPIDKKAVVCCNNCKGSIDCIS